MLQKHLVACELIPLDTSVHEKHCWDHQGNFFDIQKIQDKEMAHKKLVLER